MPDLIDSLQKLEEIKNEVDAYEYNMRMSATNADNAKRASLLLMDMLQHLCLLVQPPCPRATVINPLRFLVNLVFFLYRNYFIPCYTQALSRGAGAPNPVVNKAFEFMQPLVSHRAIYEGDVVLITNDSHGLEDSGASSSSSPQASQAVSFNIQLLEKFKQQLVKTTKQNSRVAIDYQLIQLSQQRLGNECLYFLLANQFVAVTDALPEGNRHKLFQSYLTNLAQGNEQQDFATLRKYSKPDVRYTMAKVDLAATDRSQAYLDVLPYLDAEHQGKLLKKYAPEDLPDFTLYQILECAKSIIAMQFVQERFRAMDITQHNREFLPFLLRQFPQALRGNLLTDDNLGRPLAEIVGDDFDYFYRLMRAALPYNEANPRMKALPQWLDESLVNKFLLNKSMWDLQTALYYFSTYPKQILCNYFIALRNHYRDHEQKIFNVFHNSWFLFKILQWPKHTFETRLALVEYMYLIADSKIETVLERFSKDKLFPKNLPKLRAYAASIILRNLPTKGWEVLDARGRSKSNDPFQFAFDVLSVTEENDFDNQVHLLLFLNSDNFMLLKFLLRNHKLLYLHFFQILNSFENISHQCRQAIIAAIGGEYYCATIAVLHQRTSREDICIQIWGEGDHRARYDIIDDKIFSLGAKEVSKAITQFRTRRHGYNPETAEDFGLHIAAIITCLENLGVALVCRLYGDSVTLSESEGVLTNRFHSIKEVFSIVLDKKKLFAQIQLSTTPAWIRLLWLEVVLLRKLISPTNVDVNEFEAECNTIFREILREGVTPEVKILLAYEHREQRLIKCINSERSSQELTDGVIDTEADSAASSSKVASSSDHAGSSSSAGSASGAGSSSSGSSSSHSAARPKGPAQHKTARLLPKDRLLKLMADRQLSNLEGLDWQAFCQSCDACDDPNQLTKLILDKAADDIFKQNRYFELFLHSKPFYKLLNEFKEGNVNIVDFFNDLNAIEAFKGDDPENSRIQQITKILGGRWSIAQRAILEQNVERVDACNAIWGGLTERQQKGAQQAFDIHLSNMNIDDILKSITPKRGTEAEKAAKVITRLSNLGVEGVIAAIVKTQTRVFPNLFYYIRDTDAARSKLTLAESKNENHPLWIRIALIQAYFTIVKDTFSEKLSGTLERNNQVNKRQAQLSALILMKLERNDASTRELMRAKWAGAGSAIYIISLPDMNSSDCRRQIDKAINADSQRGHIVAGSAGNRHSKYPAVASSASSAADDDNLVNTPSLSITNDDL